LTEVVFLSSLVTLKAVGIRPFQTMKYLEQGIISQIIDANLSVNPSTSTIEPTAAGAVTSNATANSRPYQEALHDDLVMTYGGSCALCGLDEDELLFASHIIPHSKDPTRAKNLNNAVLLCSLHDDLFDNGLITIVKKGANRFGILVSPGLANSSNPEASRIVADLKS
jgi:predicted restriction endonuclease